MRYLRLLSDARHANGCQLHAYTLMENHVHLLATPSEAGRIGQLVERLGRHYVAIFNHRHGRTGTLWEGHSTSCLVDSADYVLHSYRCIEPTRYALVSSTIRPRFAGPVARPISVSGDTRH